VIYSCRVRGEGGNVEGQSSKLEVIHLAREEVMVGSGGECLE
jgi:hypothetical protein